KKFNQSYETRNKPLDEEIPLVVLVDGKSASASEIVSGSLQDLDRAVVIGAKSFGKGLVQRPLKLTYGTQLKVTISRYYTPSGRCIQSLDYWNRDEEGNAVRNTQFNEFTTRNGRKVRDGGGIMPDIPIASLNTNDLVNALVNNHVLFDYATDYYYGHPDLPVEDFTLSDADFEAFKRHVSSSSFDFQTKTELALKESLTGRNNEIFGREVEEDAKALLLSIEKSKLAALDTYRKEITKPLEDEIIKRYVYREGLYDFYLNHDEAIQAGAQLLKDESKYRSVLR
uniref:S41 family peptidase n=1 Tax=Muriicola sp. TaxID=2020856 RepID=UPI00356A4601